MANPSLEEIYNRLHNAPTYHPLTADTFADWSLEAGDTVTVSRDGTQYAAPVSNTRMTWKGQQQISIEANGTKEREAISTTSKRKYVSSGAGMSGNQGIYSFVYAAESQIYSYVDQTATYIVTHVENEISDVGSEILQTANQIYTTVYAAESSLYSYVDQTATYISSHVDNVESDLHSEIVQTQNMIHSAVWTANSMVFAYVDQTATSIVQHVENEISDVGSEIQQTASQIYAAVYASESQVYSYVDQTATYIRSEVDDVQNDLHSEIMQTQSMISSAVWTANSEVFSYVNQTATSIVSHVESEMSDLGSEIVQTASQIYSTVYASNSAVYSYVDQTATYIRSEVNDVQNDLHTEILQTQSMISSAVWTANSEVFSYVNQTATSIVSHVESEISDLGSEIVQTASQIRSEVHASDSALYSYIDQTASGIRQEVASTTSDLQSSIDQQADKISMVVGGTGSNAYIKPASIVAAINNGASTVKISADHIVLDGDTVAKSLTSKDISVGELEAISLNVNGSLTVQDGFIGDLRVAGLTVDYGGGASYDISNPIASGSVSGNTLTLYYADGTTAVTFSKAASIDYLTGNWSGGSSNSLLTVATEPDTGKTWTVGFGGTTYDTNLNVYTNGTPTLSGNYLSTPVRIASLSNGTPPTITTRYETTLPIDATAAINAGAASVPRKVSGSWSGNTYTAQYDANGSSSVSTTVNTRFGSSSSGYYIAATRTDTSGNVVDIASQTYKLGLSGTTVQIQNTSGTQYTGTPTYTIPLETKSITSNNTYTPSTGKVGFSSVTVAVPLKVSGSWSGNTYTAQYNASGSSSVSTTVNTRFGSSSSGYYIAATRTDTSGNVVDIASQTYKLGLSGTTVQIQNTSGTQYSYTPTYTIPLETKSITSNNTYTPSSGKVGFSSVTVAVPLKVSGSWTNNTYTAKYDAGGSPTVSTTVGVRFNSNSGSYYIAATRTDTSGNPTDITSQTYKLGLSGTTVQIQNTSGTQYTGTPTYTIPLETKSITSNNTYTPSSGKVGFSSVTVAVPLKVSGSWTNNTYTAKYDAGGSPTASTTVGVRFNSNSGSYYIAATRTDTSGNPTDITSQTYKLGLSGKTVQIQNTSGTQYTGTPTYTIPLETKSITSNNTYTPSSGKVGFSSVTVAVTPTLSHAWTTSGTYKGLLTVTSSPSASANFTRLLSAGDPSWNGNTCTIPINAKYGSNYGSTESTGCSVTISAAARYNAGWKEAYNRVSLPGNQSSSASMVVKTPPSTVDGAATETTYTVSADNSYAYIKQGTNVKARVSHSAYYNGWVQCYNSVEASTVTSGAVSSTINLSAGGSTMIAAKAYMNNSATAKTAKQIIKVTAPAAPSYSVADFETWAYSGTPYGGHSNNSDGYYMISEGASGEAGIVVTGTFKVDGTSKSAVNYLEAAPTKIYRHAFPTDIGIYGTDDNIVTSQTITAPIDLWGGCYAGGAWRWGSKVTITPGAAATPGINIDTSRIQVSASKPSGISSYTDLSALSSAIKNNRNTYIWFRVDATKPNGSVWSSKWYRCTSA